MKVTAKISNVRLTPRKARLVAGLIQGMPVREAAVQLEKTVKKSAGPLLKLLMSAVANAKNNFSLDENNLFIVLARVNEGQKLKRWMPRAHGRATPIWRRMSHITIVLENRETGNRVEKSTKTELIERKEQTENIAMKESKTETEKSTKKPARKKEVTEGKESKEETLGE